jgi:hypothetical protein
MRRCWDRSQRARVESGLRFSSALVSYFFLRIRIITFYCNVLHTGLVNQIVLNLYVLPYFCRMTLDFTSSVHIISVILCSSLQWVIDNTQLHWHLHEGNGQTPTRADRCTNHQLGLRYLDDAACGWGGRWRCRWHGHTPHEDQMVHVALSSLVLIFFFGSLGFG